MITALLIFFPLLSAIILLFIKNAFAKKFALIFTLIELILSIYVAITFIPSLTTPQFTLTLPWITSLGINFKVGLDGISLLLVLLTNFLTPLIILSSFHNEYKNPSLFYALILIMQCGLLGVFASLNAFLFYIFWELALIPIYLISGIWGGARRIQITLKFFIYTILGSLFMLIAFIYLYYQTSPQSFDINAFYNLNLSSQAQSWIFWALFIAFAIKIPIFPFHTWQPDTYTESPSPASMLLAGIMLKMGLYGIIRWMLPIVPLGIEEWRNIAIILSIIGIVYASCIALTQNDIKRLIAYSSIAHVGLISAGIFSLNVSGMQGGIVQMLSHGVNVVGLFFIADIIFKRTNTRKISELGGISNLAPQLSIGFMVIVLATIALPLTNGFVGEFLLLLGLYEFNSLYAAIGGLTIILGAVYMLNMYRKSMFGEVNDLTKNFTDLQTNEKIVLVSIIIIIFWIGIYPEPFFKVAQPAIDNILQLANKKEISINY